MSFFKNSRWVNLICPYFSDTCRRVFNSYLKENGFIEDRLNEINGIVYSRAQVFLEISYELETVPKDLTIVLGIGGDKYDNDGHPCCVPYWYLMPSWRPEHRANTTGFRTEFELEALLVHFKNHYLESIAKPLWLNKEKLEKKIENFRAEFSC